MTLKQILRIILTPSCWIRNSQTNPYLDAVINILLDENTEFEMSTLGSTTGWRSTAHINLGGVDIWINNYPYAYGTIHNVDGLPSRTTCFRLYDFTNPTIQEWKHEKMLKALGLK